MESLRGKLLISSARLGDPNFARTVVLMIAHGEDGALGLVLNRPMEIPVNRLAEQAIGVPSPREGLLHSGGPCEAAVMVLFDDEASPDLGSEVTPGLRFSGDGEVIQALLKSPEGDVRFYIGYSGWGGGQLEGELEEEAWLVLPARGEHVFHPSDVLWDLARAELVLGSRVDPDSIPPDPSVN